MANLHLFRRREVWLPTLPGWLLLLALATAAIVLVGRCAHDFLAPNEPVPKAEVLVVEGWLGNRQLDQAIAAFRAGGYRRIVTSGGPIENWLTLHGGSSYAAMAARYLRENGLAGVDIAAVPAPVSAQDRSFLGAVVVRKWMEQQGIAAAPFDVYSSGTHARRTRMTYRAAFGPAPAIGIMAARPTDYDPDHWWRSSAGVKSVIEEGLAVLWTACCFRPPPQGSHEEMGAVPCRQVP